MPLQGAPIGAPIGVPIGIVVWVKEYPKRRRRQGQGSSWQEDSSCWDDDALDNEAAADLQTEQTEQTQISSIYNYINIYI